MGSVDEVVRPTREGGGLMLRVILLLALAGLALPPVALAQDALAQKGQQVFTDQKCSICHSVAGKGNAKGSLDHVASKWKADEIRQWITTSKEMAAKHEATRKPPMKDFAGLPKGDVDALVVYLQTLK
jgi:mono/diheme cytochrome c family protein